MGYKREPQPTHPSPGNPGVTPLPVPFLVLGSRVMLCLGNWMEIQTSSRRNHKEDNEDTPSRKPRSPPEDRPISSTYPASQKKTAISRTEGQKIAAAESAAEQEEAERRVAAHQRRAIPQVRYDTHRSSEHAHRTRPNTQRQQHAVV